MCLYVTCGCPRTPQKVLGLWSWSHKQFEPPDVGTGNQLRSLKAATTLSLSHLSSPHLKLFCLVLKNSHMKEHSMETPVKKAFMISSTEHPKVGGLSYTVLNPQNLECAFPLGLIFLGNRYSFSWVSHWRVQGLSSPGALEGGGSDSIQWIQVVGTTREASDLSAFHTGFWRRVLCR